MSSDGARTRTRRPCVERALEHAGQRLVDAKTFEMMKAKFGHANFQKDCDGSLYSPAGPTMTKERSESVAISPRLTPPG